MTEQISGGIAEIVDPNIPIIDAHHHLFDRPALRYMFEDYVADVNTGHNVIASVYVETLAMSRASGPDLLRPIGEVEFANGVAAMSASGGYGSTEVNSAIVGYADLRAGDAVAEILDKSMAIAPERYRGIRQLTLEHTSAAPFRFVTNPPAPGIMKHPQFKNGFRHLGLRGLSFDAAVFHTQLSELADLADEFPDTTIVLNHLGMALGMDMTIPERRQVFETWRTSISQLAARPNVVCKIGGLGMPFWGFEYDNHEGPCLYKNIARVWQPYVEEAIAAFGVRRCMMESNFPPDRRCCDYPTVWNALKYIVRDYSTEEKISLFCDTASKVYRIHLDFVHGMKNS